MNQKNLTVIVFFFFIVSCSINDNKEAVKTYPVLGRDPISNVVIVEEQSGVLAFWARKELQRDMAVVHLGSRGGLSFVQQDNVKQLKGLIKSGGREEVEKAVGTGGRKLIESQNYLSTAVALGIVKKVYWILPAQLFDYADIELRIQRWLANAGDGFGNQDIAGMKFDRGCVSGKLNDVAVSICSLETLPPINEPVLLDLDVDYIFQYSAERSYSKLRGVKEMFDRLTAKSLKVASADVALTDLPSRSIYRYIGAEVVEALREPGIMKSSSPPELWSLRDNVDWAFTQGEDVAKVSRAPLRKYPADKPLLQFGAVAQALRGNEPSGLATLGHLCQDDESTCSTLLYVAAELNKRGRSGRTEPFLRKNAESGVR